MSSSFDAMVVARGDANIIHGKRSVNVNNVNIYDFMDDAYHGTGGFRDGTYLVPHSREMFYAARQELCFYKNFVKPIVRAMVEPVFVKPAPRTVNPETATFSDFIWDCNNAGVYLQSFIEDVVTASRLHGVTFVVVDNFKQEQQPPTIEEAKNLRTYPYVYHKTANEVVDYSVDTFGNLTWIIFCDSKVVPEGNKDNGYRYKYWDKRYTRLLKSNSESKVTTREWPAGCNVGEKYTVIEEVEHGLNKIPVITVLSVRLRCASTILVDPFLYDVAKINLAIFNKDSELRELERAQGFSVFYVQTEGGKNLTIGPNNALILPPSGEIRIPPGFVSPDPSISTNLMASVEKLREELFRMAEQNGVTGVKSSTSGVAARWEFFAQDNILQKTSDMATIVEEKIAELFKLYTKEEFEYTVDYPDSFQPNDRMREIEEIDKYLLLNPPPKARVLALEKATKLMFADMEEDRVQAAIDEIEDEVVDKVEAEKDVEPLIEEEEEGEL